ncbi:MAG: hypothetical protein WDN25_09355 [Acetobacteraceae bacterium]
MSEDTLPAGSDSDPLAELRARAEALEQRLATAEQDARSRVARAELKVEAVRAGIVDLDGLKLLDLDVGALTSEGQIANAAEIIGQFRRAKPWLFGGASSSSRASPPPAQPPRQKLAVDMTDGEYQAARTAILKHQF